MNSLSPGMHRPVYLWAGPGTVRMNRLKFPGARVDEQVHLSAHTPQGAALIADRAGLNWAYLMYDWGFPPETAAEDFTSFQQAVHAYHASGVKVFAYIQTSNCVFEGSFAQKDWYALDSSGQRIHYYTGRYMTCWKHPAWIAHLEEVVRSALQTGADGIFFDNPWYGGQLLNLGGLWMGSAGCYCPRCQQAYQNHAGQPIPTTFHAIKPEQASYIQWRAAQVTELLARLAAYARKLNPQVVISINDFDSVMRPAQLVYGIDLPVLARVQDVVMIEDFGLPAYQPGKRSRWVNNVLTLHTASTLCAPTPISVDPYDRGIGFDSVFPARRYLQGIAEAAACGAAMVVKGTEFVEKGEFTLITAPQFEDTRLQLKKYNDWLHRHHHLFTHRANLARVGLLHPGDALWKNWFSLAPCYFGVGQALLAMGIPWRVVTRSTDFTDLDCLITCDHLLKLEIPLPDHLKVIALSALPGWTKFTPRTMPRNPAYLAAITKALRWLYNQYFQSRLVRSMLDTLGIMRRFTASPFFDLPDPAPRQRLAAELNAATPLQPSENPILIETYRQGSTTQIHLVNYGPGPVTAHLHFDSPVHGRCLSPDRENDLEISGADLSLPLDIYNLLILE